MSSDFNYTQCNIIGWKSAADLNESPRGYAIAFHVCQGHAQPKSVVRKAARNGGSCNPECQFVNLLLDRHEMNFK